MNTESQDQLCMTLLETFSDRSLHIEAENPRPSPMSEWLGVIAWNSLGSKQVNPMETLKQSNQAAVHMPF